MYKCENCQTLVPHGIKAHRVVVETRTKHYPFRKDANTYKDDGKVKHEHDYGGIGQEIVREMTVCPDCADRLNIANPTIKHTCHNRDISPKL